MAVNKEAVQVGATVDPSSGLLMFRKIDKCNLEIDKDFIEVKYIQWLQSPNGTRLNEQYKNYIVKDGGTYINDNQEEVENLGYSIWADFIITQGLVGTKLGNDLIIGAINETLKGMPFDVPSGYITKP